MIPVKPAPQGRPVGPPNVFPSGKGAFSESHRNRSRWITAFRPDRRHAITGILPHMTAPSRHRISLQYPRSVES